MNESDRSVEQAFVGRNASRALRSSAWEAIFLGARLSYNADDAEFLFLPLWSFFALSHICGDNSHMSDIPWLRWYCQINVQKSIKTDSSLNEGLILSSFFVFLYLPLYIFQKDSQNFALQHYFISRLQNYWINENRCLIRTIAHFRVVFSLSARKNLCVKYMKMCSPTGSLLCKLNSLSRESLMFFTETPFDWLTD